MDSTSYSRPKKPKGKSREGNPQEVTSASTKSKAKIKQEIMSSGLVIQQQSVELPAWVDEKQCGVPNPSDAGPSIKFQRIVQGRKPSPSNLDVAFAMLRSVGPPTWQGIPRPRLVYEAAGEIPRLYRKIQMLESQDRYNTACIQKLVTQLTHYGAWDQDDFTHYFSSSQAIPRGGAEQSQDISGAEPIFDYEQELAKQNGNDHIEPSLVDVGVGSQEHRTRDAMKYFFNTAVDETYARPTDVIANMIERWPATRRTYPDRLRADTHMVDENLSASRLPTVRMPLQKSDQNINATPPSHLRRYEESALTPTNAQGQIFTDLPELESSPFVCTAPSIPVHHLIGPKELQLPSLDFSGKENQENQPLLRRIRVRKATTPHTTPKKAKSSPRKSV